MTNQYEMHEVADDIPAMEKIHALLLGMTKPAAVAVMRDMFAERSVALLPEKELAEVLPRVGPIMDWCRKECWPPELNEKFPPLHPEMVVIPRV